MHQHLGRSIAPRIGTPFGWLCFMGLAAQSLSAQVASTPTAAGRDEAVVLSPFEVSATGDRGYLATTSAAASRVSSQLKDITQNIVVINSELIDDLAPLDLNDILRYASTVDVSEGFGEAYDIRGNNAGVPLVNGFRFPRKFPSDPANVERVEVLAGPASVLYGNVFGIGGVINRVTKKPQFRRQGSLQLRYSDNDSTYRGVADLTGPLGRSARSAYRVIAAAQNGDLAKDFGFLERYTLSPSLLIKLGKQTNLTIETEYARQRMSTGQNLGLNVDYVLYRTATGALVASSTPTTGGVANTPILIDVPDRANPEADFVRGSLHSYGGNFLLTSELSRHWSVRSAGLATWLSNIWNIPGVAGTLQPDGRRVNRARLQERDRGIGNFFFQADAAGKYTFDAAKVQLVFGSEYSVDVDGNHFKQAPTALPAFDYFNPDYSIPFPTTLVPTTWNDTRTYSWGAFGMAQVGLFKDRLLLNGGVRTVDFRQATRSNTSNGPVKFDGESGVIPKWGGIFRITPDVGVYYGYGEAYSPSTTANPDGTLLPATNGEQDEIGVKLTLLDGRLTLSGARFNLRQVNISEADPNRPGFNVPAGERTTKGYDITAAISPTDHWQIVGGYSHAASTITASLQAINIGLARVGVPDYRWKLWTRYRFPSGLLKGLAIGAGTNYVAERSVRFATGTAAALSLPNYRLFDAMASYHWRKQLTFQVNIKNIADEKYYPNGNANRFVVGDPRTLSFSTMYRF